MSEEVKEIEVMEAEEADYSKKQYIRITYTTKANEFVELASYNTPTHNHVNGINLKLFGELPFEEISFFTVLIVGRYDYIHITGLKEVETPVYIRTLQDPDDNVRIESIYLDNFNTINVSINIKGTLSCFNSKVLKIESVDLDALTSADVAVIYMYECQCNKLLLYHDEDSYPDAKFEKVTIESCSINQFSIRENIELLQVLRSSINQFSQFKVIDKYFEEYSNIKPVSKIIASNFENLNEDVCRLGMRSAAASNSLDLYIDFNDKLMTLERKKYKNPLKKLAYLYLDSTTGYGFKPIRALWFSLGIIIIFALLFSLIGLKNGDIHFTSFNSLESISTTLDVMANYLYQSGISYTTIGFSDMLNVGPVVGLLYVIEALIGISVLSLYVVALTRKYFFGK